MRKLIASITIALAFTASAQAQTLEQAAAGLIARHENSLVQMRVVENKVCVASADMVYGRTTIAERQVCINEHEAMIIQSRDRFALEIAYNAAVKYRDPSAARLKRKLDTLTAEGMKMLDALERKYGVAKQKIGQR